MDPLDSDLGATGKKSSPRCSRGHPPDGAIVSLGFSLWENRLSPHTKATQATHPPAGFVSPKDATLFCHVGGSHQGEDCASARVSVASSPIPALLQLSIREEADGIRPPHAVERGAKAVMAADRPGVPSIALRENHRVSHGGWEGGDTGERRNSTTLPPPTLGEGKKAAQLDLCRALRGRCLPTYPGKGARCE